MNFLSSLSTKREQFILVKIYQFYISAIFQVVVKKKQRLGTSPFFMKKILQGENYDNFQAAIQIFKNRRKYKIIFINYQNLGVNGH